MLFKKLLTDYFTFGKRDRIGLLALSLLIGIIYFLPLFFASEKELPVKKGSLLAVAADTMRNRENHPANKRTNLYYKRNESYRAFTPGALFSFDPNTLDASGWERLGLHPKLVRTIMNFRSKGGRFYKPEDLQKVWGLPEAFYQRVQPYITITEMPSRYENARTFPMNSSGHMERKIAILNVNEADSAALEALPGIGSRLAARIVKFRDRLGGFYAPEQVGELYGLPDSLFQKMRPFLNTSGPVRKLNINTATKEELKAHPYLRWALANAIVEYRNQHGAYTNLESLREIALVTEEVFLKLKPYLEY